MPVFAVLYRYADGSDSLRDEHRPVHREFLFSLAEPVRLLATGPFADGEPGALIIVSGPDQATVQSTFDADPFAKVGAVAGRQIREWTQVGGPWA